MYLAESNANPLWQTTLYSRPQKKKKRIPQIKFQGELAYHCQNQLNTHGKKIPYARTKRNNKQQKSTYKKRTFTLDM